MDFEILIILLNRLAEPNLAKGVWKFQY